MKPSGLQTDGNIVAVHCATLRAEKTLCRFGDAHAEISPAMSGIVTLFGICALFSDRLIDANAAHCF